MPAPDRAPSGEPAARQDDKSEEPAPTAGRRLLWFVALWGAGVCSLAVIAYGLRWVIGA